MKLTKHDKKHMALAVAGLVILIVGASAVVGGLSWAGFFGALLVALYASAVVVAAIAFQSAYRQDRARGAAARAQAAAAVTEPTAPSEGLDEPFGVPGQREWLHEERPQP